jgi:hypothetical protein
MKRSQITTKYKRCFQKKNIQEWKPFAKKWKKQEKFVMLYHQVNTTHRKSIRKYKIHKALQSVHKNREVETDQPLNKKGKEKARAEAEAEAEVAEVAVNLKIANKRTNIEKTQINKERKI